ncbi:hypothetical protein FY134_26250 (plasmid) [Agrobacterium fabrum]|uniref:hypothetical protein n=1 Tax=Agrobacterium fabrum TaxID=1176649 RepID=UPI0021D0D410|nr:hypothetical protein [Agrobacterium fabrum]UXT61201.1 hypothetical protein FY134_26250 [Agrobacterium fabrum]
MLPLTLTTAKPITLGPPRYSFIALELRGRTFESQLYQGVRMKPAHQCDRLLEYVCPELTHSNCEGIAAPPDVVEHITLLGWQHIGLARDYIWPLTGSLDFRPSRRETSYLLRDHHIL